MAELHDLTALEQGELVRSREVSPLELTEHYLARAHRIDDGAETVGAFVTLTDDLARARAGQLETLERGQVVKFGHPANLVVTTGPGDGMIRTRKPLS